MATYDDLQAANVQVTAAYQEGLLAPRVDVASKIATIVPMTSKTMIAPIAKSFGGMREWTGSRLVKRLAETSYVMTAKLYENTVAISRETVEDGNTQAALFDVKQMAAETARWMDTFVVAKLQAGETDLCYDGTAFFSDSHPVDYGNAENTDTFDNLIGSGSAPWYVMDVSKALKPLIFGLRSAPEYVNRMDPQDPYVFDRDEYIIGSRARGVAEYAFPQAIIKMKSTLDATNFETAEYQLMSRVNGQGQGLGLSATLVLVPSIHVNAARKLFGRNDLGSDGQNVHAGVNWIACDLLANS